jgi:hypothetical protein
MKNPYNQLGFLGSPQLTMKRWNLMNPFVIIMHDNVIFRSSLQNELIKIEYKVEIINDCEDIRRIQERNVFYLLVFDLFDDKAWSFMNSKVSKLHFLKASFLPVNAMQYKTDDINKIEIYCNMVALTTKLTRWRSRGN